MSEGFHRMRGGGAMATFSGFEADLLRSLASQLVELLRNEVAAPRTGEDPFEELLDFAGPTNEPEDPVLARLFPSAYRDDEESAGEFRRFTESALRDGKARNAGLVIDTLEEAGLPQELAEDGLIIDVVIEPPQVLSWLRSFTDMRLALATRLGIEDEDDTQPAWALVAEDDPRSTVRHIYDWLGFLQETLVDAVA
jgi:Domain of unknown function (DUF2017)